MQKDKQDFDDLVKKAEKQFEKFSVKVKELYEQSEDKTSASLKKILDTTRKQLMASGELSNDQAKKIKGLIEKDFKHFSEKLFEIEGQADQKLSRFKVEITSTVASFLRKAGKNLSKFAAKADESILCHAGDTANWENFVCANCGETLHLPLKEKIPPCPNCFHTAFKPQR